MPLDPQVRAALDAQAALGIPAAYTLPVPEARRQTLEQHALLALRRVPVAAVADRTIPGPAGEIAMRIYTPEGPGPFPLLVFFHGGGWVICNLETHDPTCRALCAGAGVVVVSVDYRLAPEAKFPAPLDDCLAATRWAAASGAALGVDPARIAVGGDSAGGNLAAAVALRARDEGGPALRGQLLIYPVTDHHASGMPSYAENAEGYGLTRDGMVWFWDHYLNDATDAGNPYAAPLRAADLGGLPPALVITAEYDVLRDEGDRYAERLQEAGVPTTHLRYAGMIHGFFGRIGIYDRAEEAIGEAAAWLKEMLASPNPLPCRPSNH